ncbi:MAG: PDZ domain-containing protein [Bacteroidaceae bacterium]|nr:PDZ domain-containing protein [Bacteroidaceae bacterium]
MKKILLTIALAAAAPVAYALTPLWLRASAISPDGQTICFAYKGNLFTVPSSGGDARQLTSNAAWDGLPVWSPSGKHIAFASEREGSLDLYIMTAAGDELTRLTTRSGAETPLVFLSDDELLFTSTGLPTAENMQFPSNTYTHIYKVRTREGSRPQRVSDISAGNVTIGPSGALIYDAIKGYEDPLRKHHTSSIARDLWQLSFAQHMTSDRKARPAAAPVYQQLTHTASEDRNPVYVHQTQTLYWLSEASGCFNVWSQKLEGNAKARRLTEFTDMPVRYLTASDDGMLCFSWDGELYTMRSGSQPKKVDIRIIADTNEKETLHHVFSGGATQVAHSPKGKEIAFVLGGDVYVTSLDYKTTVRITDTPSRERHVTFAEDGRSLVYDSERDGRWGLFRISIKQKNEKLFTYATELTPEERLTPQDQTCFEPEYSPDGKMIAFLRDRQEICVLDAKNKEIRSVMAPQYQYSYSDGDQSFSWSPNSKYLLSEYIGTGGWNNKDIALIPADGKGEIVNLTNSGYSEGNPRWALGGKAIIFQSDRAGYRSHGSWGAESDLYITFLNIEGYERFCMNKEERERFDEAEKERKERESKDKEETDKKDKEKREKAEKKREKMSDEQKRKADEKEAKDKKKADEKKAREDSIKAANPELDFTDLELRTVRLTYNSSNIGDCVMNSDGTQLYYVASNYPNGSALWLRDLEKGSTSIKATGVSFTAFDLSKDGKTAYYAAGGRIRKLQVEEGKISDVDFEAFHNDYPQGWRKQTFEHIWHQTHEKLYDPDMNGADWQMLHERYARQLPHVGNTRDFAELCSEMLGELNVSHTGCRYRPQSGTGNTLTTADLGAFLDDSYTGDGLRILELIPGSPLTRQHGVGAGSIITHIDGQPVRAEEDYYPLLSGKDGRYTRLTIQNQKGKAKDYTVRLSASYADALYRRWVDRNERLVDSLSHGRLAYVHIEKMNGDSFHELYRRLLADKNRVRDAVIVDTRHNGGGWLHNDVCDLLSGTATVRYTPRGSFIGEDPYNKWNKPSCMLICEDNYSNAHGTPWLYRELGIGQLVGAPVPGTMTAVWWETIDDIVFGIPQVGALDRRGHYLENQQLEPDHLIISQPGDLLHGRDLQLERAVELMMNRK